MNICFRVKDPETEKQFLVGAEERLLQGLKGHRSVVSHLYKSIDTCLKLSFVLNKLSGAVDISDQSRLNRRETSRDTDSAQFRAGSGLPTTTAYQWTISISWPST